MASFKYLLFAASLKIVFFPAAAISELRKFEMDAGRVIEGEIVDVKPGHVTLRLDGKESGLSISDFSEADRRYFREWLRRKGEVYEWPGERGFHSDGSTEEVLADGIPTVIWRAEVGQGQAAVICDASVAYTTGIRGGQFTIVALTIADGQERWKQSYPVMAEPHLAVASPAVDAEAGQVYSMGPLGRVDGWRLTDGGNVWATELPVKYPGAIFPEAGVFGSPVTRDRLYVEVGGPAYSLVAFAKSNGSESWRIGKHRSIGATPVLAELGGRQLIVSRNEYGIVGRRIETGTMAWDQAWVGKGGGRASPVAVGSDRVFVTSAQECALFRIVGDRTQQVWSNLALCSPVSTPIYHGGFIYGFNGDALTCVDAESGEVTWSTEAIAGGNLIRAAERLLVVTRGSGELVIADVDPAKYIERSRTKVFDGNSQTIPVVASGRIFCRSASGAVACLEMRAEE